MIFSTDKIKNTQDWIKTANHIIITAHKSPDGDSVGSSLGLYHYLKKKNPNVWICHPDPAPKFLHWMPGYKGIINLEEHPDDIMGHFMQADLIFCLDYNSSSRIGKMEALMNASKANKVMIDHHRDPDVDFCNIMFSDIKACSTSQLIYELIEASGDLDLIDETLGTPLYTGIVTDTGSFRFSSTLPKTHRVVADLIEHGVKNWEAHENTFDDNSLDRIKLVSYAMLEKLVVDKDLKTAYLALTKEELERFNAKKGDTEGLVNQALGIEGVRMAVFLKEVDGIVKMSFRSKSEIPVNDLARENFNGGGHLNASGGKYVGNIDDAVQKFVTILPKFVQENKALFE
jgi:phosphoesterase RecJ-like protein